MVPEKRYSSILIECQFTEKWKSFTLSWMSLKPVKIFGQYWSLTHTAQILISKSHAYNFSVGSIEWLTFFISSQNVTIFTWTLLFLEQMFMFYSVKSIKLKIDFDYRSLRNTLLNEHTYTLSSEVYWVAIQPANIEWPIPDEYQLVTEETKKVHAVPSDSCSLRKFSNS